MINKALIFTTLLLGLTVGQLIPVPTAESASLNTTIQDICSTYDGSPVLWDGLELKKGQIGRLFIQEDTHLYKFDGDTKTIARTLKKGDVYNIYNFRDTYLGVGGGYFVDRDSKILYKTPSKAKLALSQCAVTLSKAEMEKWIDREVDFERLNKYPVVHTIAEFNSLPANNQYQLHPSAFQDYTEYYTEERLNVVKGYMDTYFNRNYKTIGDAWIKKVRYYYRPWYPYVYNGVEYPIEKLPEMFNKFVQETKSNKVISESVFVTDISMLYHHQKDRRDTSERIRGTQYIRYTSGSNLPKGVTLNKWYKRDVDVQIQKPFNTNKMKWETSDWVYSELYPITDYQVVKQ